jgi:hypothetical protein
MHKHVKQGRVTLNPCSVFPDRYNLAFFRSSASQGLGVALQLDRCQRVLAEMRSLAAEVEVTYSSELIFNPILTPDYIELLVSHAPPSPARSFAAP